MPFLRVNMHRGREVSERVKLMLVSRQRNSTYLLWQLPVAPTSARRHSNLNCLFLRRDLRLFDDRAFPVADAIV